MTGVTLTQDSKITLGAMLAIVGALVGSGLWVGEKVRNAEMSVRDFNSTLSGRIDGLAAKVDGLESGRFSVEQAQLAAYREAIENPGHRVPDPANPDRIVVVYAGRIEPPKDITVTK